MNRYLIYLLVSILLLPIGCNSSTSNKTTSSTSKNVLVIMDTVSYIDSIIKVNQESRNWLVRSASFLYENYNDKPEWHSELYATVFKDSIKYLNVLDSLFIIDPKLIDKKNVIRMNLDSFLIFERRYAKERYNKFGGISDIYLRLIHTYNSSSRIK